MPVPIDACAIAIAGAGIRSNCLDHRADRECRWRCDRRCALLASAESQAQVARISSFASFAVSTALTM
jgi:hypothetical protein